MKRLAFLSWGLAVLLALLIAWQQRPPAAPRAITAAVPTPELALWTVAIPSVPQLPAMPKAAAPVAAVPDGPMPVPVPAPVATAGAANPSRPGACTRLGIFPDAEWANQVGRLLLPESERGGGPGWAVKAYPGQRYYVVFPGLDAEALTQRLKARKALLHHRVSASAHPEGCS